MATLRQLANPPLREALVDIQHSTELSAHFLGEIEGLSIPGLHKKGPITAEKFEIKIGQPAEALKRQADIIGWSFASEDGSRLAQVRRNGITYSILKGYKDWAEIRDATHRIWELYMSKVSHSVTVSRTAARYINVIDLPPQSELNDYLTAGPQIPAELPQILEIFLQRVLVRYQADIYAAITQASEPSGPVPPSARVILDIDVFANRAFAAESGELWTLADTLRGIKNAIFFSSVTERALERYA